MTLPVPPASEPPGRVPLHHPNDGNEASASAAASQGTLLAALTCASRGWPVFPCMPGRKQPATVHGFRDASTDPDQIRAWWQHRPDANLAVATGVPGPDVLDVDNHGGAGNGFTALSRLKRAGLLDSAGMLVRTPHGGLHFYFAGSDQSSGRLADQHLDFKSAGGYVLVPPSRVDDMPYAVIRASEPSGGISWAMAACLLQPESGQSGRPAGRRDGDGTRLAAWVERLREGNRNSGLYWAACRAVESGQSEALEEIAAAAARTGLTQREICRTIDSARRGTAPKADREATR